MAEIEAADSSWIRGDAESEDFNAPDSANAEEAPDAGISIKEGPVVNLFDKVTYR